MNMTQEQWKDIPGMVGRFQVSDLGRVKSLARKIKLFHGGWFIQREKILMPGLTHKGYYKIRLFVSYEDFRSHYVHRLVMIAFKGTPPKGFDQINHKNGIKTDNRIENLEWSNNSHNIKHAYHNGLFKPNIPKGLNGSRAKILVHSEYGSFQNIIEAAKENNITREKMGKMISGKILNTTKYILA